MASMEPKPITERSLRFMEILKPFSQTTIGNVTHKMMCFFYPPYSVDMVEVTNVVQEPTLDSTNVLLFFSFSILLITLIYVTYKHYLEPRSVKRAAPVGLGELEQRMLEKYGQKYDLDMWERKDIRKPLTEYPIPAPINDFSVGNDNVAVNEENAWMSETSETGLGHLADFGSAGDTASPEPKETKLLPYSTSIENIAKATYKKQSKRLNIEDENKVDADMDLVEKDELDVADLVEKSLSEAAPPTQIKKLSWKL